MRKKAFEKTPLDDSSKRHFSERSETQGCNDKKLEDEENSTRRLDGKEETKDGKHFYRPRT